MGNKASCYSSQKPCCYVETKNPNQGREYGEVLDVAPRRKEQGPFLEFPSNSPKSKRTIPLDSFMSGRDQTTPIQMHNGGFESPKRGRSTERVMPKLSFPEEPEEQLFFHEVNEEDDHLFSSVSSIEEVPGAMESDASEEDIADAFQRPRKVKITESKWHLNPPENIVFLETEMTPKEQEGILKAMSNFYLFERLTENER